LLTTTSIVRLPVAASNRHHLHVALAVLSNDNATTRSDRSHWSIMLLRCRSLNRNLSLIITMQTGSVTPAAASKGASVFSSV